MKRRVRSLISMSLIAGSLLFASCGDSKKEEKEVVTEENHPHQHSEKTADHKSTEEAMASFNDETIKKAFDEYVAVKDALVQTNPVAAAEKAASLQSTLTEVKPEIAVVAGKIAGADDVNVQRELFSELTAAMEPVLKEAITSGKIYKQFCPMAFEGKGDYWYSTSEEIMNPYFGDKMLKCGRVDETIM
ncbi:DUF3347 domain-containing protein [Christiangramia sabulilitoris]|uniref:DUF3347 domain-containing protein n=1 Tax=Christiangramia sabulilitoris TaxID=2583991 RepID=A0A550I7W4_9FLAO|nr:DUF3347 domain-containing protein [Christiangramia sabulilitoris]TRO67056.1 DUF3347 domain-containing protein [Christiangramia sabulilitoris]